jgi:hypothetical protein
LQHNAMPTDAFLANHRLMRHPVVFRWKCKLETLSVV